MALKDFKFDKLPRSAQIGIFAALGLVLAGIFYFMYLRDLIAKRDTLRSEVSQLEASVAQGRAVASQIEKFKLELAQLEERLTVLRQILPSEKETPQVLKSVQSMASASNLNIMRFVPQPIVNRTFYSDWPILMDVQGSYDALGSFFEKISEAKRIINVESLAIRGIDGSTNSSRTLNATCTATTYVFREGDEMQDIKTPAKAKKRGAK
jgi:type IV pilus assembly protein PilO